MLFQNALLMPLATTSVRVASLEHLIALKRAAGREKDLEDAGRLTQLLGRFGPMTDEPAIPSVKTFGTWQDAENLRRWSFLQRTPQQRLDWLVEALRSPPWHAPQPVQESQ